MLRSLSLLSLLLCVGCPKLYSFDEIERSRKQAKINAALNARIWIDNHQKHITSIVAQTDSSITESCPNGDGWVTVEAEDVILKCSSVSVEINCYTADEFKSKSFASQDGKCQPRNLVPFPLPVIDRNHVTR